MATPNEGTYPVDPETNVGVVRLLVGDTDSQKINERNGTAEFLWYSDKEIEALLRINGDNPKPVAVHILRQVAVSSALLLKKYTSDELSVDGAAIAEALLRAANAMERAHNADDAGEANSYFRVRPTGHRPEERIGFTTIVGQALPDYIRGL
jgi:hypothetical protein